MTPPDSSVPPNSSKEPIAALDTATLNPSTLDSAVLGTRDVAPDFATPVAKPIEASASRIPSLAILLAAMAMLGPFSIDAYLPAFPEIEASLSASAIEVQQTMTAYLLAFAVMILWHGAISDSLGRRNVILVSLAVFVVASFGCASAHSIQYLWAFRILQGVSAGAGIVVGRAMVRDLYAGAEAEKLLALVTMIFAIAPAIAPILGGWIVATFDWRTIFLALFVYSALLFWACWRRLPETLPLHLRQPFNAQSLWTSYKSVFGTLRFHMYAGTIALNFAGLFLYVAAAPAFVIGHLHQSAQGFGWMFIPSVSGIFFGALLANRLAGRLRIGRQVRIGFMLMGGAALANLVYHTLFPPRVPWSVIPLFFYTTGMSLTAPGVTLMVLDLFPAYRGVAASCQSFAQTLLASLVAGVIAPLLSVSALWLAAGQAAFVAAALVAWRIGRSRRFAGPRAA